MGLFCGLNDTALNELAHAHELVELSPGDEVFREGEPGREMFVVLDGEVEHSRNFRGKQAPKEALCVFEYVYFARPDSVMGGEMIHLVRQQMGVSSPSKPRLMPTSLSACPTPRRRTLSALRSKAACRTPKA